MPESVQPESVQLPPNVLRVKLYRGQWREVDLRLVSRVRVESQGDEVYLDFIGGPDPLEIHYSEAARVQAALRVDQERRAAQNETSWSGQNLDEATRPTVEFEGLNVYSWTPKRDGLGTPEQVHLQFDVTVAGTPVTLCQRYKTKGALNGLIDALVLHREDVWPTR